MEAARFAAVRENVRPHAQCCCFRHCWTCGKAAPMGKHGHCKTGLSQQGDDAACDAARAEGAAAGGAPQLDGAAPAAGAARLDAVPDAAGEDAAQALRRAQADAHRTLAIQVG